MTKIQWLAGAMVLLLASCGEEVISDEIGNTSKVHVDMNIPTDEVEMVMIPTPTQVPTVLSLSHCEYNSEHVTIDLMNDHPITSHQKAINLGVSIVDFSYAAINQDHELSNIKLDQCLELMNELGIDVPKDVDFLARIDENKDNVDSLSYLILTAFERSTKYFKDHDKEQLGISILTGTAVESMLLLAQDLSPDRNSTYFSFFNQQRQYASSLQIIMERYQNEEPMQKNLKIATGLESAFESFENWAASGDTTVRFDTSKANLLSDILVIKESTLN